MNIQSINLYGIFKTKNLVKSLINPLKNSSITNPIKFSGNLSDSASDTFELQDQNKDEIARIRKIVASYEEEIKGYDDFLSNTMGKNKMDVYAVQKKKFRCWKTYSKYKTYLEMLTGKPEFAPLYNPESSDSEKETLLAKNGVYNIKGLAKKLDIDCITIVSEWYKNGVFESTDKASNTLGGTFINTKSPKTAAIIEDFTKRRKDFMIVSDLKLKYNIPDNIASEYINNGALKLFGIKVENYKRKLPASNIVMIDIADKTNSRTIKEHNKICPKRSDYAESSSVSAKLLSRLGFGNVETIKELIEDGKLNGKITKLKTTAEDKYLVETEAISPKNQSVLAALRSQNENIVELKDLAARLNITPQNIKSLLLESKMEIIPEYIIESDCNEIYIDISNPKNASAIEEISKMNKLS